MRSAFCRLLQRSLTPVGLRPRKCRGNPGPVTSHKLGAERHVRASRAGRALMVAITATAAARSSIPTLWPRAAAGVGHADAAPA